MPFLATTDLLNAVKTALASIGLPGGQPEEKLFERVEFHENKRLKEALTQLVVTEQRVAIIVPGGHAFTNVKEGRTIRSMRRSTFDILIADRDWADNGQQAVFGGPDAIGVLTMGDLVVDHFAQNPQLGLAYVALQVEDGASITLADDEVKDSPGRECFVLAYSTPSGERVIRPTQPWAEPA
ncbi:hypothetical protein K0B96_06640 [Horticoccus luteus]|uniref:Uncharacterized protein n=1 Tax=Horticoccus luteus TaxID=2862869 RepID=A0A8F9XHI7_9BACT|nr:hypothetical protein [Horticoccus luteus]QYM80287.1 hypothetical protein K0B96_06640 [Horticoccus luteus]